MVDVENILSCSICMEIFRVPRVLPCQHTFCQDCLSSYISDVRKKKGKKGKAAITFKCPLCRAEVNLKEEPFDASTFPLNLTVVAFVDTPSFLDKCSGSTEKTTDIETHNSGTTDSVQALDRVLEVEKSQNTNTHAFNHFLDESDVLSSHVTGCILNPIANYKGFSFRIVLATIELFTCVCIASYVLSVIKHHDLWLIYFIFTLISLGKGILLSAWNARQHKHLRTFFRFAALHIVRHIFECALIGSLVFFVFFIVCVNESIRLAPVRRLTVMSDLGQPQCFEEKYLDFKYILNQAMQIMKLTFNKYVIQLHTLEDNWYHLLMN